MNIPPLTGISVVVSALDLPRICRLLQVKPAGLLVSSDFRNSSSHENARKSVSSIQVGRGSTVACMEWLCLSRRFTKV